MRRSAPGRVGLVPRFVLLVATGFLVPAAAIAALGWTALSGTQSGLLSDRLTLARTIAARIAGALTRDLDPLLALGALPVPEEGGYAGPAAAAALADAWHRSRLLHDVYVLSTDGTVLLREPPTSVEGPPACHEARDAFAAALERMGPTASGLLSDGTGRRRVVVLVPLRGPVGGPVRALAAGCLDPESHRLSALLADSAPGKEGSVDVLDATGKTFLSTDRSRLYRAYPPDHLAARLAAALPDAPATGEAREEGRRVLVAASPVAGFPWTVVVRQPRSEALAAVDEAAGRLVWMVPLLGLLALGLALGAAHAVRQPLAVLTREAERIAGGELTRPIPVLPRDEVGRLGRAFERMRVALAGSLEEVRRANEGLEERVRQRTEELSRLYRELAEREEARLRLLRKVIAAQEEERKRIARELHDETCQTVTALALRAEGAAELCPSEEGRKRLGDVTGLARRALDDLHRVIFDLRPSVLDDLGLFPAIRWFADRNLVPRGVSVRYDFEDLDALRLSPERETAVFRAVQEALTNVLRHSRASTVVVEAEIAARRLRIRVEDDGEGFDPGSFATPSESGRGLGLLGMRERLELLGGRAAIESEPGEGTAVVLEVPVNGPGGVDA